MGYIVASWSGHRSGQTVSLCQSHPVCLSYLIWSHRDTHSSKQPNGAMALASFSLIPTGVCMSVMASPVHYADTGLAGWDKVQTDLVVKETSFPGYLSPTLVFKTSVSILYRPASDAIIRTSSCDAVWLSISSWRFGTPALHSNCCSTHTEAHAHVWY